MTRPPRSEAAAAVAEIDADHRAIDVEAQRGLPVALTATFVLTFLDFAVKDEIASPRRRMIATALIQTALAGIATFGTRAAQVDPHAVATIPEPDRAGRLLATGVGWFATERLAVHLLRRSRLSRPNTVAGLLVAASRTATALVFFRALPHGGRDA